MNTSVKTITTLGLFSAIALAVYGFEALLPPLFPIPGMKLGLANIVTLFLLLRYDTKKTAAVLLVRILLSALLFGQVVSLFYSLCGGICCLFAEYLLLRFLSKKYLPIVSIFGAIAHNIGQLLIARLLTGTNGVFLYLPYLTLLAIATGAVLGFVAVLCNKRILRG